MKRLKPIVAWAVVDKRDGKIIEESTGALELYTNTNFIKTICGGVNSSEKLVKVEIREVKK